VKLTFGLGLSVHSVAAIAVLCTHHPNRRGYEREQSLTAPCQC
jgi:hypothetical protein